MSQFHYPKDCSKKTCAWKASERIWELWGDWGLTNSIPWEQFISGNFAYERGSTVPHDSTYHFGGYLFSTQSIDTICAMIMLFIWFKRCRTHFNRHHSMRNLLKSAWTTTIEGGMVTWAAIRKHKSIMGPK